MLHFLRSRRQERELRAEAEQKREAAQRHGRLAEIKQEEVQNYVPWTLTVFTGEDSSDTYGLMGIGVLVQVMLAENVLNVSYVPKDAVSLNDRLITHCYALHSILGYEERGAHRPPRTFTRPTF